MSSASFPEATLLPAQSSILAFVVVECFLIVAFIVFNLSLYLPILIVGLIYCYWSIKKPQIWIFTLVVFQFLTLEKSEGITTWELLYGVYFYIPLALWFVKQIFFNHRTIFHRWVDLSLFLFTLTCFLSVGVSILYKTEPYFWFREFLTIVTLLLFFPAKEVMETEKGIKIVVLAFVVLTLSFALRNIVTYSSAATAATYYWEILGSRQPASAHFFFATLIGAAGFWIQSGKSNKLVLLVIMGLSLLGLIITFARGFWIGALFSLTILFLLARPDQRIKMLSSFSLIAIVIAALVLLYAGRITEVFLKVVIERFTSSGNALADVSITNRIAESVAVLEAIKESPILGHGIGSSFRFYSLLSKSTVETFYIHNGYLFMLFKVGLIGSLLFFAFYGGVLLRGIRTARNSFGNDLLKSIVHGVVAILAGFLLIAITSNVFIEKESLLVITLGSAFLVAIDRKSKSDIVVAKSAQE